MTNEVYEKENLENVYFEKESSEKDNSENGTSGKGSI